MATDMIRMRSLLHGTGGDRGSSLQRFVAGVLDKGNALRDRGLSAAKSLGHAVRQGAEEGAVGAGLGFLDSHLGGLEVTAHRIPVDAVGGAAGVVVSVALDAMGHGEFAPDLRNMGTAALTVFGYRKTKAFFDARKGTTTTHGDYPYPQTNAAYPGMTDDIGADPIVARARAL